jgi:hypothetical protein
MTESTEACVPVTIGVTAHDVTGASDAARTGRFARRCDARADGLGRTLYLNPLAPPEAPGRVRLECRFFEGGKPKIDTSCTAALESSTLTWQDRSDDEDGFHVFARLRGSNNYDACEPRSGSPRSQRTAWTQIAALPAGARSWPLPDVRRIDRRLGSPKWNHKNDIELMVAAYNDAGDSQRVGQVRVYVRPFEFDCSGP